MTPVDAQGNKGTPSPVASFTWLWPSTTTTRLTDLVAAPEVIDPQFSWDPVPAPRGTRSRSTRRATSPRARGSAAPPRSIGTSLTSTVLFKDNVYYWRVRAIDADGNAGLWNIGPSFTKTFDKVAARERTVIKNLRMSDNLADPGTTCTGRRATRRRADPALGRGARRLELPRRGCAVSSGLGCNWTAATSGASRRRPPRGLRSAVWNGIKPYADARAVANDGIQSLAAGTSYCARVRARADRDGANGDIYGDYT